jgi:hypothetical protein
MDDGLLVWHAFRFITKEINMPDPRYPEQNPQNPTSPQTPVEEPQRSTPRKEEIDPQANQ